MNNVPLQIQQVIDDNSVKVIIPINTPVGTYDITANFTYHNEKGSEPMGIVIHVIQ